VHITAPPGDVARRRRSLRRAAQIRLPEGNRRLRGRVNRCQQIAHLLVRGRHRRQAVTVTGRQRSTVKSAPAQIN
jgi:hypothetical protein